VLDAIHKAITADDHSCEPIFDALVAMDRPTLLRALGMPEVDIHIGQLLTELKDLRYEIEPLRSLAGDTLKAQHHAEAAEADAHALAEAIALYFNDGHTQANALVVMGALEEHDHRVGRTAEGERERLTSE
jgi:hypothetical protein